MVEVRLFNNCYHTGNKQINPTGITEAYCNSAHNLSHKYMDCHILIIKSHGLGTTNVIRMTNTRSEEVVYQEAGTQCTVDSIESFMQIKVFQSFSAIK